MPLPLRLHGVRRRRVELDGDAQLVERAKAGDRGAFEELVRRHANHLYAVVYRLCRSAEEAEDITQDAFLRAWRGIAEFHGSARFFTWLYRIGINEAKRRVARRPRAGMLARLDETGAADPPDLSEAPHVRAEQAELRDALARAVRSLPQTSRGADSARHRGLVDHRCGQRARSKRGGFQEPAAPCPARRPPSNRGATRGRRRLGHVIARPPSED